MLRRDLGHQFRINKPTDKVNLAFSWFALCTLLVVVLAGWPLFSLAHHGENNGLYEEETSFLSGRVIGALFNDPHSYFRIADIEDESQKWIIELDAETELTELGWTHDMLQDDDLVTVKIFAHKNGKNAGKLAAVINFERQDTEEATLFIADDYNGEPWSERANALGAKCENGLENCLVLAAKDCDALIEPEQDGLSATQMQ